MTHTSVQEGFKFKEIYETKKFCIGATSKLQPIDEYQISDNINKRPRQADTRNHKSEVEAKHPKQITAFLKVRHRLGSMPELDGRPRCGYANSLLRGDMPSFGLGKGPVWTALRPPMGGMP